MKSTNKQHWQNPSTKELQQRKYSHFLFSEIYTTFLLRHQIFTKYSNKIMYNNTLVRWYELLEFRHIQSHVNVGGGITVYQPACASANQTSCLSACQQAEIKRETCSQNRISCSLYCRMLLLSGESVSHLTSPWIRPRFPIGCKGVME